MHVSQMWIISEQPVAYIVYFAKKNGAICYKHLFMINYVTIDVYYVDIAVDIAKRH